MLPSCSPDVGGGRLKVVTQTRLTIEMDCIKKICAALAVIAAVLLLTGCDKQLDVSDSSIEEASRTSAPITVGEKTAPIIKEETDEKAESETKWTDEDLKAIARTLAGECYDDKTKDKRLVCEVILNRVSDGRFGGDTIIEVLTAENQFTGYWRQSRSVSENDLEVAEKALSDWYEGDCAPLSEYLFFYAGDNRENVFRSEY